jgi:hypothetical protein
VFDQSIKLTAPGCVNGTRLFWEVFARREQTEDKDWNGETKQISDSAFGAGSLSALVVPVTLGNAVQADPVEERGASLCSIVNGKHGGNIEA